MKTLFAASCYNTMAASALLNMTSTMMTAKGTMERQTAETKHNSHFVEYNLFIYFTSCAQALPQTCLPDTVIVPC